jgi:hypothetical protein
MVRLRLIKIYGNSFAIKLFPSDMEDFGLKVGDKINIEEITPPKSKKTTNPSFDEENIE